MIKRRKRFKNWFADIAPAVPLRMAPDYLNAPAERVRGAIQKGLLPVHTFHCADGRLLRYVRVEDLDRALNPAPKITIEGMRYAMMKMIEQDSTP